MKGHLKIRFRKIQSNMYFSDIDPLKDSSKLRYFGNIRLLKLYKT